MAEQDDGKKGEGMGKKRRERRGGKGKKRRKGKGRVKGSEGILEGE